jgi:hypothetical protein
MNANSITTGDDAPQAHPRNCSPPKQDPLKEALIAPASLHLHLRLHRRDAGPQRLVVIDRLLDVSDAFGRSIEWLRGITVATDNRTDSRALPDSIGAGAP